MEWYSLTLCPLIHYTGTPVCALLLTYIMMYIINLSHKDKCLHELHEPTNWVLQFIQFSLKMSHSLTGSVPGDEPRIPVWRFQVSGKYRLDRYMNKIFLKNSTSGIVFDVFCISFWVKSVLLFMWTASDTSMIGSFWTAVRI